MTMESKKACVLGSRCLLIDPRMIVFLVIMLVNLEVRFVPILLQKSYGDVSDERMESELRMQRIEVALLQPSAIQSCAPRPPKYFCYSICQMRTKSLKSLMSALATRRPMAVFDQLIGSAAIVPDEVARQ